jgi:hypothetical protein
MKHIRAKTGLYAGLALAAVAMAAGIVVGTALSPTANRPTPQELSIVRQACVEAPTEWADAGPLDFAQVVALGQRAADMNARWRPFVADLQLFTDYLATPVMEVDGEKAAWARIAADCQAISNLG